MEIKGIDIYHGDGDIDFKKVKAAGYDFVIVKLGGSERSNGTRWTSPRFYEYVLRAKDAGLHVGAYFYAGQQCTTEGEGKQDAWHCISVLQGIKLDYPIFYDYEEPSDYDPDGNTDACVGFCEEMEKAGYYVGVYASDIYGFKERLRIDRLKPYDLWVARYGNRPKYVPEHLVCMWQFTSSGEVDGCPGHVDEDVSYVDYPSIIIPKGFNNY